MKLVGRYAITIVTLLASVILVMLSIQLWQHDRSARELKALSQSSMQEQLDEQVTHRAATLAGVLAENISPLLLSYDMTAMYQLLLPIRTDSSVQAVYVFDESGQIIHDASRELDAYGLRISERVAGFDGDQTEPHVISTRDSLAAIAPILAGGVTLGGVYVEMSRQEVTEPLARLQQSFDTIANERRDANITATAIGALFLMFIGVGLSMLAARSLALPIVGLAGQTRRFAAGEYDADAGIDRGDEIGDLAVAFRDMGLELSARSERIRFLAYHDGLTGLANRTAFSEALGTWLDSADAPVTGAVLFVDLNKFKRVNDTLGHEAGDALLPQVASSVVAALDELGVPRMPFGRDTLEPVARWGGDEFTIFLAGVADMTAANPIIERLLGIISQPRSVAGIDIVIGASIGVAFYPQDGARVDTLLNHADVAMYHAKESHTSVVQTFSPEMTAASSGNLTLEADLRGALANDEFRVAFEPFYDPTQHVLHGFEAHLYWQHPRRGRLDVSSFMPIAETVGVAGDISCWVIDAALTEFARWHRDSARDLELAINLYSLSVDPRIVADRLADGIELAAVDSSRVMLEISEARLFHDVMSAIRLLQAVRILGVPTWIDGFGSGFSSIHRLRQLTIDGIKFDHSLIGALDEYERDGTLVAAIISAAHTLGLRAGAADVTSQSQLAMLRSAGCDCVQGPRLRAPLAAGDVVDFLQEAQVA